MNTAEPFQGIRASDEYSLCKELGKAAAQKRLENHWNTWFMESDVDALKAAGINAYVPLLFYLSIFGIEKRLYVDGN